MRLLHLSDLHLGYRQFQRQTKGGINQREADVARTFTRVIAQAIAIAPDVIVIAGDVFHSVRPSNPAIVHAFRQFERLTKALPNTLVVMIAGNHDDPRATDTGYILPLFESLGIQVVTTPRRIDWWPLSILCVPDTRGERPALEPSTNRRAQINVLLLHGEVEGMMKRPLDGEIPLSQLGAERFDYVALGHYHVMRAVAPNACYAGAIDYTSTDVFGEMREERAAGLGGKGMLEVDLATGERTWHPIAASRRFIDLEPIAARELTPAEIDALIAARVEATDIEGAVVRLVIHDIERATWNAVNQRAITKHKARALSFKVDPRRPEMIRVGTTNIFVKRKGVREVVSERLQQFALAPGLDPERFVAVGMQYLDDAPDSNTAVTVDETVASEEAA